VKIPAAWLVEKAGFHKGYRVGNVGVSQNHSLALVNYGGTTAELLDLAARIQQTVHERFGISLEREPVMVPF
jgi:UDP-N-acetylmuramate dehydrogenase